VLNLANINTIVANIISITGNVTGTNLSLSGTVTANYIVSNLDISATGNIVGSQNLTLTGNVSAANTSLSGTITVPRITSSSNANITITPNGTGNLNLENIAVNNTTLSTISVGNLITFAGTTGIVLPVGNQIQRPSSPPAGTTRFNTTANDLETWNGSAWIVGNSGNLGQITDQQFNGDGTTTTFTLTHTSTTAATLVYINGVGQLPGISYTVTGNLITFNQAPLSADTIDIRFISYVTTIESITNDYGNSYVQVDDTPAINFVVAGNSAATINSTGVFQVQGSSLQLPTYNVAQTASIVSPQPGQVIYVSNGDSGAPTLAVYDGTSWKRVALGTTIST
jgi:cytoskeletal protein CcmA (bactofilin family)